MSMLSPEAAVKEIASLKSQPLNTQQKLEKFNQVIARIEPGEAVTDRKFTFWSGGFSPNYQSSGSRWQNISSNVASIALANQSEQVGIIKDTNYAKVLLDKRVQADYLEVKNIDPDDKAAVKSARKEYASSLNGPWGQASQSLAENVRGDVLAFTPFETGKSSTLENGEQISKANNIFADREFPALLNNSSVTSINGLPTEALRAIRDNPDLGIDAARHEVNLASREYVKGLHTQTSLNGDQLCFNKEFLDKQSLQQVENFQNKLDQSGKSVSKNSPEVASEQDKSLHKMYKDGNPKHAAKESQLGQENDTDLKKKLEANNIKALDSRSGKYEGEVLDTNKEQVAQQVGKHVYVHKMNPKEHDLSNGDFAKIRTSKGVVKSVEKLSLDKQKSKGPEIKKSAPPKGMHR